MLEFAATHAAYLYPCYVGVSGAPYVEGFSVAFDTFWGYLDGVGLHGFIGGFIY